MWGGTPSGGASRAGKDGDELVFRAVSRQQLSETEIDGLAAFFDNAFPRWPARRIEVSARDHLLWKLEGAGDGPAVILGHSGGELVVAQTLWHQWVRLRGRKVRRIVFNDLAVAPSHRGKGLSSRENLFKDEYFSNHEYMHIGATRQRALAGQWRRRGLLSLPASVSLLLHPLDGPRKPAERRGATDLALRLTLRAGGRWGKISQAAPPGAGTIAVRPLQHFDERVEPLLDAALRQYDVAPLRSVEHLNWRYCDPRGGDFVARGAWSRDGRLLGYAITGRTKPRATLAELLVEPSRLDAAVVLADDSIALCRDPEIRALECWLPRAHPYYGILRGRGFSAIRRRLQLGYRTVGLPHDAAASLEHPQSALHFMLGDTDFV